MVSLTFYGGVNEIGGNMTRLSKCIECGSKKLAVVKKNLTFERNNPGKIKVNDQECIECKNCGELYFDEEQSDELAKKIDKKIKS